MPTPPETKHVTERWDKLKAGLYDAICGKGLDQPYLDATAELMDELKAEHEELLRALTDVMEAVGGVVALPSECWPEEWAKARAAIARATGAQP